MREFFGNVQSPYVKTAPRAFRLIKICNKFISSIKNFLYQWTSKIMWHIAYKC